MPYTRDQWVQRLQLFFEDTTYYSSADFNASVQDGYNEIAAFAGLFLKSAVLPFQANLSYYDMITLFPDYLGVVAVFNNAIKRWMFPTSVIKLDNDRIDWETALGVPYYFTVVSHRYMAIYKKPSVTNYGDMYIFYRAAAPTLGSNDTIQIPDDYLLALEDYTLTDLWEQNQEWSKAAVHMEAYKETVGELRKWIKSNRMPDRMPQLRG